MTNPVINVLPHQRDFILSSARNTCLVAGFGAGKTHAGVLKTILKKLERPVLNVSYYLPTYSLINDIAVPRFKELLTGIGLTFKYNETKKRLMVFNGGLYAGDIILRSMDKPETIVGYETFYALIDEADTMPATKMDVIYEMILPRTRQTDGRPDTRNRIDVVSTPNGLGWIYDFFVRKANPNKKIIKARTQDNPYLPDDFVENLIEKYDSKKIQAYLNGEFVRLDTGQVFYEYDEEKCNTDKTIHDSNTLYIGLDFNIGKMSAVVYIDVKGVMYAVDEIVNAFDTYQTAQIIKERYKGKTIVIYPDPSGQARKTASGSVTDIQILKSAGFLVKYRKKAPTIADRVSFFNAGLRDGKIFVNKNTCPNFSDALIRLGYDDNGMPDKKSGLDHITDAGSYAYYFHKRKLNISL